LASGKRTVTLQSQSRQNTSLGRRMSA